MDIAVRIEPTPGDSLPDVRYRWDADTDILCATLGTRAGERRAAPAVSERVAESVEVEGKDGSWLVLDVASGGIEGVEIAVWPDLRRRATLAAPTAAEEGRAVLPPRNGKRDTYEVTTELAAESDEGERTIHFTLGARRPTRAVRIARDLVLDVDHQDRLAGLWLLNVPPCPDPT
jgi:hypothetical protein